MDLVRELLERRRQVPDGNGLAQVQTCLRAFVSLSSAPRCCNILSFVVGWQQAMPDLELDINEKDDDGCSPLFVSLLYGAPLFGRWNESWKLCITCSVLVPPPLGYGVSCSGSRS